MAIVLWSIAGLFLAGVLIGAVAIALSWERAIPYIITRTTGRDFSVGGVQARFFTWRPWLVLEDVKLGNAPWSKDKQMLEVGRFEIRLSVRRLLHGSIVFPRLRLDDAIARLEAREDGTDNWTLWTTEAAKPDDRTEVPAFRNLRVRNTRITYVRHGSSEPGLDVQIANASGTVAKDVVVQATGRYQKSPAKVTLKAGSIAALHDPSTPYPLDVVLSAADTSATIRGHLRGPLDQGGLDVQMTLAGDTLSELFPLIGVVLPSSPPYRLTGRLEHENNNWRYIGFDGKMGDSDLSGTVNVALGGKKPFMTAEFRSKRLDFDDLAGLVGAPPSAKPGETASSEQKAESAKVARSGLVLPDTPVDVPRLNAMDIDAHLVADHVDAPNHLPIDRLDFHFILKDGQLRAVPANFDVAGGRVELNATLFGDRKPTRVEADVKARGVRVARIIGNTPFTDETRGSLGGEIRIAMQGASLRDMAGTADGSARLAMSDARVSHLLLELAGLDLMESIGVFAQGDKPMDVRCAAFDFTATDGKVSSNLFVIDTDDTNITADAKLDLKTEHLSLAIMPHPKDISLLSLRQRLLVEGRLNDLHFYPDPLKLGAVDGVMQKLNFLLAPIVGLLTPFDLSLSDSDKGCQAFLNEHNAGSSTNIAVSDRKGSTRTASSARALENGGEKKSLGERIKAKFASKFGHKPDDEKTASKTSPAAKRPPSRKK